MSICYARHLTYDKKSFYDVFTLLKPRSHKQHKCKHKKWVFFIFLPLRLHLRASTFNVWICKNASANARLKFTLRLHLCCSCEPGFSELNWHEVESNMSNLSTNGTDYLQSQTLINVSYYYCYIDKSRTTNRKKLKQIDISWPLAEWLKLYKSLVQLRQRLFLDDDVIV